MNTNKTLPPDPAPRHRAGACTPAAAGAETCVVAARRHRAVRPGAARPRSGPFGRAVRRHPARRGAGRVREPLRLGRASNATATGSPTTRTARCVPTLAWTCPAIRAPSTGRPWRPMAWTSPSCARATAATPRVRCTPTSASRRTSTAPRRQAWPRASTSSRRPSRPTKPARRPTSCSGSWPAAPSTCPSPSTTNPSPTTRTREPSRGPRAGRLRPRVLRAHRAGGLRHARVRQQTRHRPVRRR